MPSTCAKDGSIVFAAGEGSASKRGGSKSIADWIDSTSGPIAHLPDGRYAVDSQRYVHRYASLVSSYVIE